jgi:hypothetical protein
MSGGAAVGPSRRLARWAAGLSLLPIPLWFVVGVLSAPAPAWRAEYRSGEAAVASNAPAAATGTEVEAAAGEAAEEGPGAGEAAPGDAVGSDAVESDAVESEAAGGTSTTSPGTSVAPTAAFSVVSERELQHYWDRNNMGVPPGINVLSFSARYDACLSADAALQVPVMLVADGAASFAVDGVERLRVESRKRRGTRGAILELSPGAHRLSVEFAAHGWSSVALLASFDGRAPRAVGSGSLAPGVSVRAPGAGADPCAAR